jgi:hypothetical protein
MTTYRMPDGSVFCIPESLPTPHQTIREFLRRAGQRGGLERGRRYALRSARHRLRFQQHYRCNPDEVKAAAASAGPDVRPWLKEFASKGGRARARKYTPEQLRVWAAKGGHAKAAKSAHSSTGRPCIAGKQASE